MLLIIIVRSRNCFNSKLFELGYVMHIVIPNKLLNTKKVKPNIHGLIFYF